MSETFLPPKGNYRNLIVFQKTECIYDITYYFAHKYFAKGDRTIDQMIQAAVKTSRKEQRQQLRLPKQK